MDLQGLNSADAAVLVGSVIITNLGFIVGSYVSMKVSIAKLEVLVGTLSKDVDNLAEILETNRSKNQKKEGIK